MDKIYKDNKTTHQPTRTNKAKARSAGPMGSTALALALIVFLAIIVYSGTLDSPFIWDEEPLITNNTLVHSLEYYTHPSRAQGHPRYDAIARRYVSYLSFALNYTAGATDVAGYHIVNIAIHALTACLIYMLVLGIMSTSAMSGSSLRERKRELALLSAAAFAVHPLMTEAVTYIFQRQASLVAMLYILSIVLYGASRNRQSKALYMASVFAAVLAMKTKENAFTLPVMILLYEYMFLEGRTGKRVLRLLPFALTMLIIPATLAHLSQVLKPAAGAVAVIPVSERMLKPAEYLYTQMPVVLKYLRMLLFPAGQNIDHAYTVHSSPLSPAVIGPALFHLAMLLGAGWLWKRSRDMRSGGAKGGTGLLAAFGVLWFYITVAVESTIKPLPMIITEYRVYLPAAGLMPAIFAIAMTGYSKLDRRKTLLAKKGLLISTGIVLILGWGTLMRNELWATELSIWQDSADKSPSKARPLMHVGLAHEKLGQYDKALRAYTRAVELEPDHYMAQYDVGAILNKQGRFDEAEPYFRKALELNPVNTGSLNNLATILMRKGQTGQAEIYLRQAIGLSPNNSNALYNITLIMLNGKRYAEAIPLLLKLNSLVPPNPDIMSKIGLAYRETGNIKEARRVLTDSMQRFPADHWSALNLGVLEENQNNMPEAEKLYKKAIRLAGDRDYVPMAALARLYIKTDRFYKGMDLLSEAQVKFPEAREINELRKYIYGLMGRKQSAN